MKLPSEREIAFTAIDESAGHDWDSLKYPPIYQEGFIDGAKWIKRLALKRTSEWVSVGADLPESGQDVLFYDGSVKKGWFDDFNNIDKTKGRFFWDLGNGRIFWELGNANNSVDQSKVTHWQPISPPKGDE